MPGDCAASCSLQVEELFLSRLARNIPEFTLQVQPAAKPLTCHGHWNTKRSQLKCFLIFSHCWP